MPESPEKTFYDFLQLSKEDRRWVLEHIAKDHDGNPIDMYVAAAMVLDADQFEEAKKLLKERGYVPLANPELR
ncbi:MAG TPA: hypothetical protein PLU88_10260 [Armatimonadota bacterium]|jgi:hypothetical protein|nr:hypothetical protein [Armatimonadota bacterium]HOM72779.1 hypothetical protein [Armatimonadota bacterium]HOP80889.1 hypothetical protein [Armatimonadota bacterium]HPP75491.1 hypothetical protein [Armatimonadota bacterium]